MIMMLSHPHPQSELFPKKLPLLPHPPQKKSKKMIQIMELHPHPLLELGDVHPHPVAVKSLIVFASKRFFVLWFIICGMACMCFRFQKIFLAVRLRPNGWKISNNLLHNM